MYKSFALSTLLVILIPVANAQTPSEKGFYLGAHYSVQGIDYRPSVDYEAFGLSAGYQFSPYLSIETRLNQGTSGYSRPFSEDIVPNATYKEEIDKQVALIAKASYPFAETFGVYALLGWTKSDYEFTTTLTSTDAQGNTTVTYPSYIEHSETGLSYGLGLEYQIADSVSVFAEYQILPDLDLGAGDESWTSTSVGITYSF